MIATRKTDTAKFPPEPKTDTTAQPARQTTVSFFFSGRNRQNCAPNRQTTVSFFSGRNNDRAPARQTSVSFFSGRNKNFPPHQKNCQFPARTKNWHNSTTRHTGDCIFFFSGHNFQNRAPNRQTTVSFFSGCNNDRTPARQTTGTCFFPVVIKLSRHNKKTANFPP